MFDVTVYLREKTKHVMLLSCLGVKLVSVTPSCIEFCIFHEFHSSFTPKTNDLGHDTDFLPNRPALNRSNPTLESYKFINRITAIAPP